jgi:hypothetical protein
MPALEPVLLMISVFLKKYFLQILSEDGAGGGGQDSGLWYLPLTCLALL